MTPLTDRRPSSVPPRARALPAQPNPGRGFGRGAEPPFEVARRVARSSQGAIGYPRRPRLGLWLLLALLVLAAGGQAVPLYTDWLWFKEVGFTQVFTTRLTLGSWLFMGLGAAVFVFLFANLSLAARTAPPDVYWELEDQLGLPGRAILEPLVRRLLLPVVGVIALFAGGRGAAAWDTVLQYWNATPFGRVDPLFDRDLGFYLFVLPTWRLVHGWATALVTGTLVLTAAVYVLQRSLVLTARGPRLAGAARLHLLALGALVLVLRAVGFWLDRYDLLYSPRGVVFGASYTDVNASLPVLGWLAVLALACAAACLVQMVVAGLALPRGRTHGAGVLLGSRAGRLPGPAPAVQGDAQRAGGRAPLHRAQHPDDARGLPASIGSPRRTSRRRTTSTPRRSSATASPSRTSASGTTARSSSPTASSRRSGRTTSSSTWTWTATRSTASTAR